MSRSTVGACGGDLVRGIEDRVSGGRTEDKGSYKIRRYRVEGSAKGSGRRLEKGTDKRSDKSSDVLFEESLDRFIDDFIRSQVTGRGLDERTEKAYRMDLEHFSRWLEKEGCAAAGEAGKDRRSDRPDRELTDRELPAMGFPSDLKGKVERYLDHLARERRLRTSTISRKSRVCGYFLGYLVRQGAVDEESVPSAPKWMGAGKDQAQVSAEGAGGASAESADGMPFETEDKMSAETTDGMPAGAAARIPAGGWAAASRRKAASPLSKKEIDAFFRAIEREKEGLDSDFRKRVCLRDMVMMELLFYHGIEVSELLRLELPDYDQRSGILTVRRKRGQDRNIYLYSRALRERMELWMAEHGSFEHEAEYGERMFLSKLGRPLSMKMVINIFDKYRVLAGIEREATPKDLKGSMGEYARELMREVCG